MLLTTDKFHGSIDIDCSQSSVATSAWFKVTGETARFYITYTSGANWCYEVPADIALVGLGMESVGRFINLVLKPSGTGRNVR